MARPIHKLSDAEVKAAGPGRLGDGGGLWLEVTLAGSRAWLFMWKADRRRSVMGLGGYPSISLARARKLASEARSCLSQRIDPREARKAVIAVPKFGEFADALIDDLAGGFGNAKHVEQWRMTLGETYCKSLRDKQVNEIETAHVLEVLKPIWQSKAETASRLRGRIERVLDAAKAKGLRGGENPARWRGHLDKLLSKRKKLQRGHHAAMDYGEVPAFIADLRQRPATAARALEFTILTAARSGETYGAVWSEIDLKSKVWTVPAVRMKAAREHRVPLTLHMVAILEEMATLGTDGYVFPGKRKGKPLSNLAMTMLMRRMKIYVTVHGFRSSFRDWCGEVSTFPREVAEAALAHVIGDETERAYRRGDALEKRRKLMNAWANFLANGDKGKVVELRPRREAGQSDA
jgi:integrase